MSIEQEIADACVTQALVDKERAKIENEAAAYSSYLASKVNLACLGWDLENPPKKPGPIQPRLLNQVYHSVIVDDLWTVLKKNKNPTINFKRLQNAVYNKVVRMCHDGGPCRK